MSDGSETVCVLVLGAAAATLVRSPAQLSGAGDIAAILTSILGGALVPTVLLPSWLAMLAPLSPGYWAMRCCRAVLDGPSGVSTTASVLGLDDVRRPRPDRQRVAPALADSLRPLGPAHVPAKKRGATGKHLDDLIALLPGERRATATTGAAGSVQAVGAWDRCSWRPRCGASWACKPCSTARVAAGPATAWPSPIARWSWWATACACRRASTRLARWLETDFVCDRRGRRWLPQ